ncbi:MAG TPA: hypothetical protein DIS78_05585 [Lachnospiraceae bacterium]|nr:hypothetical protein [Lachnospiraceae bacterium]
MVATAETLNKLNTLNERDFIMVVDLINRLSNTNTLSNDVDVFDDIRKRTSNAPMTDEEIAEEVNAARRTLYADSH